MGKDLVIVKGNTTLSENISLSDRVGKLKDTLVVENSTGLSRIIVKLYLRRKVLPNHMRDLELNNLF
ncbi:hypothetical protein P8452_18472 [Trifolium repens]|nr:hypothetical protein P8452_18472 [Trifolium repens]